MLQHLVEQKDGWIWPKGDVHTWDAVWREVDSELEPLLSFVRHKGVCVQAGGNGGIWVSKLAERFERVYTFEPDAVNFRCLVHNVPQANVVFTNGAVGDKPDLIKMRYPFGKANPGAAQIETGGIVPVYRIDALGLDRLDLLQLDVEGCEHNALRGAERLIMEHKPVICLEMQEADLATLYGSSNEQISLWLADRGYILVKQMHMDRVWVHGG